MADVFIISRLELYFVELLKRNTFYQIALCCIVQIPMGEWAQYELRISSWDSDVGHFQGRRPTNFVIILPKNDPRDLDKQRLFVEKLLVNLVLRIAMAMSCCYLMLWWNYPDLYRPNPIVHLQCKLQSLQWNCICHSCRLGGAGHEEQCLNQTIQIANSKYM